jgi:hypothetical protein
MGANDQIIVDVVLEPGDMSLPASRLILSIFWWFLVFLGILLFFEFVRIPNVDYRPFSRAFTFLILIGVAIGVGVLWPRVKVSRMFRQFPSFGKRRRIVIRSDGISVESEDAKAECKWALFWEIQETRKSFLLKQSSRAATYIPKRCFQAPEDVLRFKALLRAHYKGKLKLRN